MSKRVTASAPESHPVVPPVQILILGEKLMIKCKGIQIVISFQSADPEEPPCRCVGCGCPVIVQPSSAQQQ